MGDQEASALSPGEKIQATLAHVLQVVTWWIAPLSILLINHLMERAVFGLVLVGWIAPLVILLINRHSRFVRFHALQVLSFQVLYVVLWTVLVPLLGIFWLSGSVVSVLLVMGAMGLWVLLLVVAIVYGVKAARGEWAKYPVLGDLALRALKISPPTT